MLRLQNPAPLLLLVGAALALLAVHRLGLRINLTASMPRGLYRLTSRTVQRGDLVAACLLKPAATMALERGYLHGGSCPSGVEPIFKALLAAPPDEVTLTPDAVLVNGTQVPLSAPVIADHLGRPLSPLPFRTYRLTNSVWLHSSYHPLSYDSRYFGPVPIKQVLGVLQPLWTE